MSQNPIKGCQEGKATARLLEVDCPKCGSVVEVFVNMGGSPDKTGRTKSDEICPSCGHVIHEGTALESLTIAF